MGGKATEIIMIVLALDASSDAAAAALVCDGVLLCEHTLNNGKNHSVKLLPMIENMLAETGISFEDIDVYACGVGPGSFTGVRIGVATAKGFAQSHNKQMAALSSLEILAENIHSFSDLRVACVHARADELYCAAFNEKGTPVIEPTVMTLSELLAALAGTKCLLVGSGALRYQKEFAEALGEKAVAASLSSHVIRGGAAAELAYKKATEGKLISYEQMAPVYLRASQAEREYKEKK